MKCVFFSHAFTSCWNNGHAHFLRGVARELVHLGHAVTVYEPREGWSRTNALADGGERALAEAEVLIPGVDVRRYDPDALDLEEALDGAGMVVVQEWNEPSLISAIGRHRRNASFQLLFHDPHHRAVTLPHEIDALDLEFYDGVLAFGERLRQVYERRGWGRRAFTWHEAADTALFHPRPVQIKDCDLIWIGNWGEGERSRELREFLIEPASRLGLRARIHGVRYPESAKHLLREAGIDYAGWLPNHRVPEAFARARVTVHVPREAYSQMLAGIPTIRVFEALACGIPLICSPWQDEENLFGGDAYLQVSDSGGMARALRTVLIDGDLASALSRRGLDCVNSAHTCRHRAEELLGIVGLLVQSPPTDRGHRDTRDIKTTDMETRDMEAAQ